MAKVSISHTIESAENSDLKLTRYFHNSSDTTTSRAFTCNEEFTHAQKYCVKPKKSGWLNVLFYCNDGRTYVVYDQSTGKELNVCQGLMIVKVEKDKKFTFYGRNSADWGLHIKYICITED